MATSLIEVISDLEPSTQYEVRVRAVNNANMSGNISQVEVFTELPMGKYYGRYCPVCLFCVCVFCVAVAVVTVDIVVLVVVVALAPDAVFRITIG